MTISPSASTRTPSGGAASALADFAERTALPVFTRNAARGLLPEQHPQCYGGSPGLGVFKSDLVLVIGASTTIAEYMLPSLLGDFKKQYPDINVHLKVSNSDGIVSMVENNDIDLGVVEAPVLNKNLVVEECRKDRLVASVPPQQLAASDAPLAVIYQALTGREPVTITLIAVGLAVGWQILVVADLAPVTRGLTTVQWLLIGLGSLFFVLIIVGLVLLCAWLVREMRVNQRQQAFLDAVTHEMKTPLASMRLFLETLGRHDLAPDRRKAFLGRMEEDVERLEHTVSQVLAAARSEASVRRPRARSAWRRPRCPPPLREPNRRKARRCAGPFGK